MWHLRQLFSILAIATSSAAAQPVDFNRDVRPILSGNCFKCHGFDEAQRKAKLRLDVRSEKLDPAELLHRVLSADPEERMPPAEHGKALSEEEVGVLEKMDRPGIAVCEALGRSCRQKNRRRYQRVATRLTISSESG